MMYAVKKVALFFEMSAVKRNSPTARVYGERQNNFCLRAQFKRESVSNDLKRRKRRIHKLNNAPRAMASSSKGSNRGVPSSQSFSRSSNKTKLQVV